MQTKLQYVLQPKMNDGVPNPVKPNSGRVEPNDIEVFENINIFTGWQECIYNEMNKWTRQ